jgi:A/G-specific adenine glycosylase
MAFPRPGVRPLLFRYSNRSERLVKENGRSMRNAAPVTRSLEAVQRSLLAWYEIHGRARLPWRVVRNPYYTLVSEFMLQQTQVERVVPKFTSFVRRFPDVVALARASVADVLREWKGLGYNSRAVRLKGVADAAAERHGGTIPNDAAALRALPGIGPYTAAAIRAFAFDLDDAPIDTNIRRIVHRLQFGLERPAKASPRELDERARALVPRGQAHDWNSALMDLGAAICTARAPKCLLCPLQQQCSAAPVDAAALDRARIAAAGPRSPQGSVPFERTTRYARGRIVDRLRELPPGERISLLDLHHALEPMLRRSVDEVAGIVFALERDGLVATDGEAVALRE